MLNNILNNLENMEELERELVIEDTNELGFIFVKSTDILNSCGYILSAATIARFKEHDNKEVPVIIVDWNFEDLSRNSQEFMIYHELGHIELQADMLKQQNHNMTYRTEDIEFEADEYAMNKVGKENAIKAMEEIIEVTNEITFGLNEVGINEMKKRLENLRK